MSEQPIFEEVVRANGTTFTARHAGTHWLNPGDAPVYGVLTGDEAHWSNTSPTKLLSPPKRICFAVPPKNQNFSAEAIRKMRENWDATPAKWSTHVAIGDASGIILPSVHDEAVRRTQCRECPGHMSLYCRNPLHTDRVVVGGLAPTLVKMTGGLLDQLPTAPLLEHAAPVLTTTEIDQELMQRAMRTVQ